MKIAVYSDLHLEFWRPGQGFGPPVGLEADVVVLAGDISRPGTRAVQAATELFRSGQGQGPHPELVLVPGNHEYYRCELAAERAAMQKAAQVAGVHLLDKACTVLHGVRFIGATLWTDYELPVKVGSQWLSRRERAMRVAGRSLNDHRFIDLETDEGRRTFLPQDALELHRQERAFILGQLQQPFDGPTVVVTHHLPRLESVVERYQADWLSPAFASRLPDDAFQVPSLWIHGHTHDSLDYRVGNCRVVCNPAGYPRPMSPNGLENDRFDTALVVEL